jgi:hypothetical protein
VSSTVNFAAATHPSNLDIEGNDVLLYCGCWCFLTNVNATTLSTTALFSTTAQGVYGCIVLR